MQVGDVVERWKVIAPAPSLISGRTSRPRWLCRCTCGSEREVLAQSLTLAQRSPTGGSRSCGCLAREVATKHGEISGNRPSPEYQAWLSAKKRCYSPTNPSYADYGARGIRMCDRWRDDFSAFLEDVGRRPTPAHSLDRENANGHYEPGNCRWADIGTQNRNRRCVTLYEFKGDGLTLGQIARVLGINRDAARRMARRGELLPLGQQGNQA